MKNNVFSLVFLCLLFLFSCSKSNVSVYNSDALTIENFRLEEIFFTAHEADIKVEQNKIGEDMEHALVPLVFTENGFLHTPESYLLVLQEQKEVASFFTDLKTFKKLSGKKNLEDYAKTLPFQGREVYIFDPYELNPLTREETFEIMNNIPNRKPIKGGQDFSNAIASGRSANNAPNAIGNILWVGDIAIKYQPTTISGILGHAGIVCELDNGGVKGGNPNDYRTKTMEAIGFKPNDADEVVKTSYKNSWTPADPYWMGLIYAPNVSISKLELIQYFVKSQDSDNYSLTTNKYTTDSWYCSKLVWQPYYTIANSDFDRGGGYYVLPVDLFLAGYYQHNGANLYYYYIR